MSERDNILARVREALRAPAAKPGRHDHTPHPGAASPLTFRDVLPLVGATRQDQVELFRRNAVDLRADFHLIAGTDALREHLGRMREAEGWKRVATHSGRLTTPAAQSLGLPVCQVDGGYASRDLEACDVGLSECDALVAQTGSVLVTSRSAGGRGLSVLPPHHVVLAQLDQLVAGLPEAFSLVKSKYASGYPSMISLITGPSRTGDIERILVLGAHGPKKLTILCLT